MNIQVGNGEVNENRVVTVSKEITIDFKLDEDGAVIGGEETITTQELYELLNPVEVEEKIETPSELGEY